MKVQQESFIASLERLLGNAKLGKAKIQVMADKVSAIAVPIILIIAVASLLFWWVRVDFSTGLFAFLSVVLVACPCALGIATPAALWVAVSESSQKGVLFRSLETLERLATVRTVFFDKTGTLTKGEPTLREIISKGEHLLKSDHKVLTVIQAISSNSHHPLSKALATALPKNGYTQDDIRDFKEYPSQGVEGFIDGCEVRLGKQSFVSSDVPHVDFIADQEAVTSVWCRVNDIISNSVEQIQFIFDDSLTSSTGNVMHRLHTDGYKTMILSGDKKSVAESLAKELHTDALGELTASDKLKVVRDTPGSAFVGDGMNDAAAIAGAQVGIAFSNGSDITRVEADVVLFDRDLERIPEVLSLSKKTMKIVKQNLWWAFGYNAIGVAFAALGMLNPIIAALAMVLSSMFVIQNSLRLKGVVD
jgi:P-type Cu+ transporter